MWNAMYANAAKIIFTKFNFQSFSCWLNKNHICSSVEAIQNIITGLGKANFFYIIWNCRKFWNHINCSTRNHISRTILVRMEK